MRRSYLLVLLPSLAGAALSVYAYVGPDTGVDGSAGALLALVGAVASAAGAALALALSPSLPGWASGLLVALLGLATLLTAVAAWFLMQTAFTVMMALAFVGLLLALAVPDRRAAR